MSHIKEKNPIQLRISAPRYVFNNSTEAKTMKIFAETLCAQHYNFMGQQLSGLRHRFMNLVTVILNLILGPKKGEQ